MPSLKTVRLDRQGLTEISPLEDPGNVHSLYLQQNEIEKIENLHSMSSLRFLTLAGNKIKQIENLQALSSLQFLDLSDNLIAQLDLDELPKNLIILNLTGNPCTAEKEYRTRLADALPHLRDLDNQPVLSKKDSKTDCSEEREEATSSEDEDDYYTHEAWSTDRVRDMFKTFREELLHQSEQRIRYATNEHESRMEEIEMLDGSAPSARRLIQEQTSAVNERKLEGPKEAPGSHPVDSNVNARETSGKLQRSKANSARMKQSQDVTRMLPAISDDRHKKNSLGMSRSVKAIHSPQCTCSVPKPGSAGKKKAANTPIKSANDMKRPVKISSLSGKASSRIQSTESALLAVDSQEKNSRAAAGKDRTAPSVNPRRFAAFQGN
ncbi:leucine-rich repeat-containing protein 46-like [Erpetoichthys calabaricus]|uniref:Leucine-rich repeat-containing protein 46 n=1 Tax=Erpetoichthys calabaricus TaxID=27687 RepID=A0A8C4TG17_ERPCA|nr:leucine-rich repeat-containing protein 46-like [Erpetoichthys calabaricus]